MDFIGTTFQSLIQLLMRHKILLTVLSFILYMAFFDEYNLKTRYKVAQTNHKLSEQKESYFNLIKMAKQDKVDLESNYEKFAREKYKMSKSNEDVFIIETKKKEEN